MAVEVESTDPSAALVSRERRGRKKVSRCLSRRREEKDLHAGRDSSGSSSGSGDGSGRHSSSSRGSNGGSRGGGSGNV